MNQTASPKKIVNAQTVVAAALLAGAAAAAWTILAPSGQQVTEDAYVDGNIVQLTPQVSGSVTAIGADNTDYVQAGQVLVQLNETDAQLALARAEAALAKAVRAVRVQFSNASQFRANVTLPDTWGVSCTILPST
jgi:membrane fusion protein (multidrug efflux system)